MIQVTTLDQILVAERVPRQAAKISSGGGFATPVMREHEVEADDAPLVSSTMRGQFLPVPCKDNVARSAFAEIELADEPLLLGQMFDALWRLSVDREWPNRCTSLAQARPCMEALGMEPAALLVPLSLLGVACGSEVSEDDANKLMATQGHIAEIDGLRVLTAAGLATNSAILVTHPMLAGEYTRADTHLSVFLRRVDRAFVLVREESDATA